MPVTEDTFAYFKLHGSIHWYWDATTRSAESMVQLRLPTEWGRGAAQGWMPDSHAPGKEPVIVPPTVAKTEFFSNPVIRQLWTDAYRAIRAADRLFLVGYSVPAHDLLVAAMLSEARRERGAIPTWIVNRDEEVANRMRDIGYDDASFFVAKDKKEPISEFVDWLGRG